jgi:hypothetical protein
MAESELSELVGSKSEDLSIEYKSWLDTRNPEARAKLAKHIAALCNQGGGYLVFGVDDKTRIPMGETTLDRRIFSQDEMAGIVRRYLDPRPAVRVEEAEHEGVRYPIVIVPSHESRPVVPIADGPKNGSGKPIGIRVGIIYIRKAGPESAPISSPDEWNALLDRCLAHRADLMGAVFRQALTRPGRPAPETTATLKAAIEATAKDFAEQVLELAELVKPEDHERIKRMSANFCTVGYALVGKDGSLAELHNLRGLSDRASVGMHRYAYNGWASFLPLTVPERAPQMRTGTLLGEEQTYLEGMRLPATNLLSGALDYWRVYEVGVAVSAGGYREDFVRISRGGTVPYINIMQVVWRIHSILAHARLIGQETPGLQQVIVRMDWCGLANRMLMWDFDGSYVAPGRVTDDRFAKTVALTWAELRDSYFNALLRVVTPVLDLFPTGGGSSPAGQLTRERVEAELKRFGDAARLFDD